jgi:hypothetical protein
MEVVEGVEDILSLGDVTAFRFLVKSLVSKERAPLYVGNTELAEPRCLTGLCGQRKVVRALGR